MREPTYIDEDGDAGRNPGPPAPTTLDLLTGLVREAGLIVRQDSEQARKELRESAREVLRLAPAMLVAAAGLIVLLFAAAAALDLVLGQPWLSALVVGGVAAGAGLGWIVVARRR